MRNREYWALLGIGMLVGLPLLIAGCGGGGGSGGGSANSVSVVINGALWVAFQDGKNGTWRTLSTSGGNAPLTDPAGRYSVAWVCPGTKTRVNVVHTTRAELPSFNATCGPASTPTTVNVTVEVAGLDGGSALTGIGETPFANTQTQSIPSGSYDVLSIRSMGGVPNRLWLEPNRSFTTDTTYTVNFNQTDGTLVRVVDVNAGTVTVSGADPIEQVVGRYFYVSSGRNTLIGLRTIVGNGTLMRYPIFPAGVASAGTLFRLDVVGTNRGAILLRSSFGNTATVSLPQPFTSAQFTVNPTGPVQITVSNISYAETPRAYWLILPQGNLRWHVLFTQAWLAGDSSYTTPDLSSLTGWNPSWSLARGGQEAQLIALLSDMPIGALMQYFTERPLTTAGEIRFATRKQSVPIP